MSFMILAGGLDRLTTVLTANYNDFTDGSRSQFQDLDQQREREKGETQSETRGKETEVTKKILRQKCKIKIKQKKIKN